MELINEFTLEGKNFVDIDFSEVKTIDEFAGMAADVKSVVAKHNENSLYTITNIENMRVDSISKDIIADLLVHNKPYVKYGVIIGIDGIKKVMANSILRAIERTNMGFAFSKEQAIEWLLQQEDTDG